MDYKDYYAVMGLPRDASLDEIRRTYRKLARRYHPDVSKEANAEHRFKELGEAYEVLKDPKRRAAYDQLGSDWRAGQDFRPPPDWDAGFQFTGDAFKQGEQAAFSDFFQAMFGHGGWTGAAGFRPGRDAAGGGRGADHNARIEVGLEDVFNGSTLSLQLAIPEYDTRGRRRDRVRKLQVKIPRGVTNGKRIRLPGQGAAGRPGGHAGDLFLEVHMRAHPLFQVDGKDLLLNLPITPSEAALGAKIEVPTPAGRVDLNIPAGARSGQRLRLRGRGIPVPGGAPGDQLVVLQIVVPAADTPAKKALYERMAQEMPFDPRAHLAG